MINLRNDSKKEKTAFVLTAFFKNSLYNWENLHNKTIKHCTTYEIQKHDETFGVIYTNKLFKLVKTGLEYNLLVMIIECCHCLTSHFVLPNKTRCLDHKNELTLQRRQSSLLELVNTAEVKSCENAVMISELNTNINRQKKPTCYFTDMAKHWKLKS